MRVIVGCEFSQIVTIGFRERGHEAYSCDILPSEGGHPEWHIQDDILKVLERERFDLGIFHPPCTYLSNAGIGFFNEEKWGDKARERKRLREEALQFVIRLSNAPIDKICIENPVGYLNSHFRKPEQTIHPYFFGDADKKRTCLWLKNLPRLIHTKENNLFDKTTHVEVKPISVTVRKPSKYYKGGEIKNHYFVSAEKDPHIRSKTFPGIAKAMAEQWG